MNSKFTRLYIPILALVTVLLASLACGSSTTQKLATAVQQSAATTPTSVSKSTQSPTQKPEATDSSPSRETIKLINQGFGQDGIQVGFAFIVENPNAGLAIEDSQYQIAIYNADGVVVGTDSGYINLLLPSQKLGFGGTTYLDDGVIASKIEVQLSEGDATPADSIPSFSVDSVVYTADDFFSNATGVVSSPYERDITDLRVSAVAYNAAGDIIGGGFTFLNFILANSTTGVKVSIVSVKDVASIELYPVISSLSSITTNDSVPSGATNPVLSKQGFGQDDRQVGFGMLIENSNKDFSIENSQYHITAYTENGAVAAVEEGYMEVLLPKQILGIGGSTILESGITVARLDIQIMAGSFEKSDILPYFTAENISYQESQFSGKVTGQIVSPYTKDITDARVSAIAYNEAGDIIGGGFTFVDFVPANGKAAVEVSVITAEKPSAVELYATVSAISEFK